MKLSARIMAHPARGEMAMDLAERLDVPITWDRDDRPPNGNADRVWRTARDAWLAHESGADWHAVIQDDAIPCRDFLAGLERALGHVPEHAVVSPYLGTARNVATRWRLLAERADREEAAWVRTDRVAWGVCLVLPVRHIESMIKFADPKYAVPDDMRVGAWAERNRVEVWYTWPSLVDHALVPSLTKHRATDRVAARFHPGSALDIDWSGPVVADPAFARRTAVRSRPSRTRVPW